MLATPLAGGSVTGRVELKDSHIASVRKNRDYSGVVVWLLPSDGAPGASHRWQTRAPDPEGQDLYAACTGDRDRNNRRFSELTIRFSTMRSQISAANCSTLACMPRDSSRSFRFQRSGTVRIFCNIHPTMSAVILVVDTPYFTVSGRDGDFEIASVTPGEYQLKVFHERATETVLDELERRISVGAGTLTLPPIEISESGYLPAPHKNKYGKDYPKTVEDSPIYPGLTNPGAGN